MEHMSRSSKGSQTCSLTPTKPRRSGYKPSDTETERNESPWHDHNRKNGTPNPAEEHKVESKLPKHISPLKLSQRNCSKVKYDEGSSPPRSTPLPRKHSRKSPYKPRRDDFRNIDPLSKHVSHCKPGKEEHKLMHETGNGESVSLNRKQSHSKTPTRIERGTIAQLLETARVKGNSNPIRRSVTAPRQRGREKDQQNNIGFDHPERKGGETTPSPILNNMIRKEREASEVKQQSIGEINETVANAKTSTSPMHNGAMFESTESISPGDIFFSRDAVALGMKKNASAFPNNGGSKNHFLPKPPKYAQNKSAPFQQKKANQNVDRKARGSSSGTGLSRTTMTSSSVASRRRNGKLSTGSSKISDGSNRSFSASLGKFPANIRKGQSEAWLACLMRRGPCRTSMKSPERKTFDEASFIGKAFVVEKLRQFWADKYRPASLDGFSCHKQEAQLLKQLASHESYPHILFKGPSGSGKKSLTMALLHEIYGDPCLNVSYALRQFQDQTSTQVVVPLTSSAHHVELNVNLEPNAKYALMRLIKEISSNYAITPEVSTAHFKADYKAIVLYEVDKAADGIHHLIKWIMDCHSDSCKFILCCEDDIHVLESVKNRCKVITVDAPVTHEIMEILIQIAMKEDFDLSMNFAAKIAAKSKQDLRKAIMALEACKAHKEVNEENILPTCMPSHVKTNDHICSNIMMLCQCSYPFAEDQPIPLGWEEEVIEVATEILVDPSQNRLFFIRGKLQKLLVDFVHPKLILQKLVEYFLKQVETGIKRELYYWHAYYDKRLPPGTTALLKLEEFLAKFMSIHRKSSGNRQFE